MDPKCASAILVNLVCSLLMASEGGANCSVDFACFKLSMLLPLEITIPEMGLLNFGSSCIDMLLFSVLCSLMSPSISDRLDGKLVTSRPLLNDGKGVMRCTELSSELWFLIIWLALTKVWRMLAFSSCDFTSFLLLARSFEVAPLVEGLCEPSAIMNYWKLPGCC